MNDQVMDKIEAVLEREIKAVLGAHGGSAEVVDYQDGRLVLRLGGQCAGCPSALFSTRSYIEEVLQNLVPEVKEVILDDRVDPALLEQAREILFGGRGREKK